MLKQILGRRKIEIRNIKYGFCKVNNVIEIKNEKDWQEQVLDSQQTLILDFYADWCGPCKKLYPILEKQVNTQTDYKLAKINVDNCGEAASMMGVQSIPHVFLVKNQQVHESFIGIPQQDKLDKFFQKAKDLANEK